MIKDKIIKLCKDARLCESIICHVLNYIKEEEAESITLIERNGNEILFYSKNDVMWDRYFNRKMKKITEYEPKN